MFDRFFFRGWTLQKLPARGQGPRFVFNATDLGTGTDFRFSRPYMGSYRVGLVEKPGVRIADAVAASGAFPPFFSPLVIKLDPEKVRKVQGADLHDRVELRSKVALTDGGAYDNMALEPIVGRCRVALVSDAGGNLSISPPSWKWALWSLQVIRTLEIAVSQAHALRSSALSDMRSTQPFALWSTRSDPKAFERWTKPAFEVHAGWPEYVATRSTRMWPFPPKDRKWLVNWGYVTSDLALRSFVWKDAQPPTALPFRDATFEGPPPAAKDVAGDPIEKR
jgi:NTE family protein